MTPTQTARALSEIPLRAAGAMRGLPLSVVICVFVLLGPAFAPSADAQMRRGHGLQVNVDTNWVDGPGYYPVRITVTPLPGARRDRRLRLEFEPRTYGGRSSTVVAACDLVVPASGGSVTTTLSVPKLAPWYMFQLRVFEGGGRELENLAYENQSITSQQILPNQWGNNWNQGYPSILFIGKKSPDATNLLQAMNLQVASAAIQFQPVPSGNLQSMTMPSVPLDQLPARWINYSALDVICLSMDQLAKLVDEHPRRAGAMRSWVAAGGNLWIYDLGDDFSRIDSLERLIELPLPAPNIKRVPDDSPADEDEVAARLALLVRRGWMSPRGDLIAGRNVDRSSKNSRSRRSGGDQANSDKETSQEEDGGKAEGQKSDSEASTEGDDDDRLKVLHHALLLGRVTAFSSDDPFSRDMKEWRRVMGTHLVNLQWKLRHGLDPSGGNADFIKFLIPGVGKVPVTMFNVLITLFVVAIGPVNYWMLRRRRRLHLLVVTVPLCAGLATAALVAYALAADGFSIRGRARSYTQIDQRRGEAVCWARLSYYAGLAPAGGLVFGSDTMVMPLFQGRSWNGGDGGPRKLTYWDQKQHLRSGWLRSRTPTQFLTVRARKTESRLIVRESEGGDSVNVENRLGTRIDHLLLVDSEGNVFEGSKIEGDATRTLAPSEAVSTVDTLYEMLTSHQLSVPAGMLTSRASGLGGGGMFGRFWPSNGDQATGLLESSLRQLESITPAQLEPNSYIAVVKRSPELQFGLERLDEEEGFHVIVGTW